MSKYYKAEDVIRAIEAMENCYNGWSDTYDKAQIIGVLEEMPTIEVSEGDELKFYYVDSIDEYWVGQRLDNFYYAKWNSKLGFVWSVSRYLPWGEHIVDENTLWKEHTYPSEPREIPFTEWIVGFMKKYGSKVSEDAISRADILKYAYKRDGVMCVSVDSIKLAPSVTPKEKEVVYGNEHNCIMTLFGECSYSETGCGDCAVVEKVRDALAKTQMKTQNSNENSKESEWIKSHISWEEWECLECGGACLYDAAGKTVKSKFCPNCGAKMKGADDE